MFFSLNGFGDLLFFVVVVAFVLIITKDDNPQNVDGLCSLKIKLCKPEIYPTANDNKRLQSTTNV